MEGIEEKEVSVVGPPMIKQYLCKVMCQFPGN